mmetsp:Transcript_18531/g.21330  ORF Transcript_18531/g.21330 Transcript_18531/m.21330 type:complete len:152 (-) Transcript_18531:232-687(-)
MVHDNGLETRSKVNIMLHNKNRYSDQTTSRDGRLMTYCPILERNRQCELQSLIEDTIPHNVNVTTIPIIVTYTSSNIINPIQNLSVTMLCVSDNMCRTWESSRDVLKNVRISALSISDNNTMFVEYCLVIYSFSSLPSRFAHETCFSHNAD